MQFDANGHPIFEGHDESVYDFEREERREARQSGQAKKPHRIRLLGLALAVWIITLAAASVSVWIGLDLIAGHSISVREAVGGGWLILAVGGYAGAKARA